MPGGRHGWLCVSKPIRSHELLEAMQPFFTAPQTTVHATAEAPQRAPLKETSSKETPLAEIVNWEAVLLTVSGDVALLRSVVEEAIKEYPMLMQRLDDALAASDAATVSRAAHTIKGSARIFSVTQIEQLAVEIESLAAEGDLERISELVTPLDTVMQRLLDALRQYLDDTDGSM